MQKKFTTRPLSHAEQRLYLMLEAEGLNVFTIDDVSKFKHGFSRQYIHVLLHRLKEKGWITRAGPRVYLRLPASAAVDGKVYIEDPFAIALKLFHGYLAFQTALKVHSLSEYQSFTVFVATKQKSKTVKLAEQYEIKALALKKRFTGYMRKGSYIVSTVAKTFFDCFFHPQYAGGLNEVLKSLYSCDTMDWKEFLSYCKRLGSDSFCQKSGYLLELIERDTGFKVPRSVVGYLKSRVRTKTRLVPQVKGGHLVKDWLVIDNVGRNRLLSWWLRG